MSLNLWTPDPHRGVLQNGCHLASKKKACGNGWSCCNAPAHACAWPLASPNATTIPSMIMFNVHLACVRALPAPRVCVRSPRCTAHHVTGVDVPRAAPDVRRPHGPSHMCRWRSRTPLVVIGRRRCDQQTDPSLRVRVDCASLAGNFAVPHMYKDEALHKPIMSWTLDSIVEGLARGNDDAGGACHLDLSLLSKKASANASSQLELLQCQATCTAAARAIHMLCPRSRARAAVHSHDADHPGHPRVLLTVPCTLTPERHPCGWPRIERVESQRHCCCGCHGGRRLACVPGCGHAQTMQRTLSRRCFKGRARRGGHAAACVTVWLATGTSGSCQVSIVPVVVWWCPRWRGSVPTRGRARSLPHPRQRSPG